jgi:hypothetical protein
MSAVERSSLCRSGLDVAYLVYPTEDAARKRCWMTVSMLKEQGATALDDAVEGIDCRENVQDSNNVTKQELKSLQH